MEIITASHKRGNSATNILSQQDEEGQVTDMISFYTLPSTVMHHPVHKQLKAAYSFYNVCQKTPLVDLMQDALILAKQVKSGKKTAYKPSGPSLLVSLA